MTDKELLERAAKAAGYTLMWCNGCEFIDQKEGPWSPLSNDGDALRLAVKLKMDLLQYADEDSDPKHACVNYTTCEDYGDDPYAATRRAIVRAAAQLA